MTGMGDTELRAADAAEPARSLRRGLASVALLAVLLGGLAFAVPGLRHAIEQTKHVGAAWMALAAVLELGSCLGYVVAFQRVFARTPRRLAADMQDLRVGETGFEPATARPPAGTIQLRRLGFGRVERL
jgi:hypothetical protein